ncbi:MAG: hypothetical protein JKY56_13415 [Kofleriaceae bacterium]|nr:hypothetical protein [Kofleriaceae bacterium]
MSKPLKLVLFALVLSLPTAALAQSDDTAAPAEETADDDEFDFSDDGSGELLGSDENPDVPAYGFADRSAPKEDAIKSTGPSGYPLRAIDRPINLPGGMSEVTLTSDVNVDPFAVGGLLRGAYGITKEAQLSLNYGLGAFSDSNFSTGKAVALEGQYLIKNFLAVQIAVPVYLDPLAVGLVLGVPMRFQFFDKLRLDIGRDFLGIKLHEFLPSIENARQNDRFIGNLANNTIIPQYTIKTSVIGTYQHTDATALNAELGVQFDDSESAATTLMHVGVLHSTSNKFDLGARIGAVDMASFTDSFALRLFLRVRI